MVAPGFGGTWVHLSEPVDLACRRAHSLPAGTNPPASCLHRFPLVRHRNLDPHAAERDTRRNSLADVLMSLMFSDKRESWQMRTSFLNQQPRELVKVESD